MIEHEPVTISEVYRRLVEMDERWDKKLDAIDTQVRLTNGRTTRLEERVAVLRTYVQPLKLHPPMIVADGESLSIKVTPKMWALLASVFTGLSIFSPLVADWLKRVFGS